MHPDAFDEHDHELARDAAFRDFWRALEHADPADLTRGAYCSEADRARLLALFASFVDDATRRDDDDSTPLPF